NQQGSRVIRGNLLVVPVADALLYVEPLYLQASGSALPELKRVIVAYGSRIAMEPTLEAALARIFVGLPAGPPGQPPAAAPPAGPAAGVSASSRARIAALAAEAGARYDRAQAALRAGDFAAYGREIDALGRVLAELKRATESP